VPVPPVRTAAFEAFVAPARARPALWRLALGSLLAGLVWLAAAALLLGTAGGPRSLLLLYLASFAALLAATALAARLLHGRGFATLLGPGGFRPRHFAAGIVVVLALFAASSIPSMTVASPIRQSGLLAWAAWLPLVLPLLLVQTAAEEVAFRGYLLQGLAVRFRSPLIWWLLPAGLFGLLHWNPVEFGDDAWLAALSAAVVGLVLAHVTVRTGNLSAAIGLHFANNAVAMLVLAVPSPLASFSLWLLALPQGDDGLRRLLLGLDLAATLAAWGVWLVVDDRLRRLHSRGGGSI
jgi:membrane protease YdiL (CAAX protease family)